MNRRLIVWSGLSLAGIAVFLSLGIWQVERRAWKLDLIDKVDRRIHAAPGAIPAPQQWPSVNAQDDAYRHVRVRGRFIAHKDTFVKAVTALGGGFWVLTPLRTTGGAIVLVNRGFVPADRRDGIGHGIRQQVGDPDHAAPARTLGQHLEARVVMVEPPAGGGIGEAPRVMVQGDDALARHHAVGKGNDADIPLQHGPGHVAAGEARGDGADIRDRRPGGLRRDIERDLAADRRHQAAPP